MRWLFVLVLVAGCGNDDGGDVDAGRGVDAGEMSERDGGPRDDGGAEDAGGRVDAGGDVDAGSDEEDAGPEPEGCDGSEIFCEDFEGFPEGSAESDDWTLFTDRGSLSIDGERARGERALHVHTDGNGYAFLRLPITAPGNSYFGRMYLWVTAFPSAPDWAHYTLVEGTGSGSSERVRPVGGQFVPDCCGGPGAFWGIGADGGPTGDWTNWRTSAPSESGTWTCVEWEIDASENLVRLTFDGEPNDDLVVDGDDHGGSDADFVFPSFDDWKIGWQLYQGGPSPSSFDLWIDDLVFAEERVGCD